MGERENEREGTREGYEEDERGDGAAAGYAPRSADTDRAIAPTLPFQGRVAAGHCPDLQQDES
ncbi:MAG: hypothetical protein AVDCRST_MAG18-4404 [uncultured Thermomicrobiales bacterium]|uniref:Uncharacterized protein n=1 Tax=uncultured Thermomicrobiales bacterium TaxID=1645740 RepID=A0A6J4VW10_9BACT|nr:MAG: hypothetical protein AVDCRST_MAG18-4404 [uncultured Thermomicrobiales bacterium]